MPMTYSDANASIYTSDYFRGRVRTATSSYTNYLLNADVADPDYDTKTAVGTRLAQQADMIVSQLMFTLAGDAEVQTEGPAISDATLQMIVEKTIKKLYPPESIVPPTSAFAGPYYPMKPPAPPKQ